jgi:spore germination cell wall hydrolase CwlJ-like protein
MSDVERRQTRQRSLAIAACAMAFAVGGPLIGHRFEIQKTEEAYRAEAIVLAQSLGSRPDAIQLVSFTNAASPAAILQQAVFRETAASAALSGATLRKRDSTALSGLTSFTFEHLGLVEREESELDCLARAVYYEARSETIEGQKAVAEVVLNRVRDSRFPKTICEVVYQGRYRETGCQFTFTCDGSLRHKPFGEAWERARAVALNVSLGFSAPMTNKATHYHTDYVNPYWKAGLVETTVIGTHIFYRFPKTGKEWTQARIRLDAQDRRNAAPELVEAGIETPMDADGLAAAALVRISAEPAKQPAAPAAKIPVASTTVGPASAL